MVSILTRQELENLSTEELKILLDEYDTQKTIFDGIQNATKINLNSCFGTMGNEFFAWYKRVMAEAITLGAQCCTQTVFQVINDHMYNLYGKKDDYIIASDTDSIVFAASLVAKEKEGCPKNEVIEHVAKFARGSVLTEINSALTSLSNDLNCPSNKLSLKLEAICDKAIFFAKKRYAIDVVYDENGIRTKPKRKIVGVEIVRSETPKISRKMLSKTIDLMFDGSQEEVYKELITVEDMFDKAKPSDISFNMSVSDIRKWIDSQGKFKSGATAQAKAAYAYNKLLKEQGLDQKYEYIREGDKMKFVYLKTPNPCGFESMGFNSELPTEFGLDAYIDRKTQYDKSYLKKVENMVSFIGWNTVKKNVVSDYFGF